MPAVRSCRGWKVRTVKTREYVYTAERFDRHRQPHDEVRYAYTFEECFHRRVSDYPYDVGTKARCYECGPSATEIRERLRRRR